MNRNRIFAILAMLLTGVSAVAQTKPTSEAKLPASTPPSVVSVVESVTGKRFQPDTTYAALSADDTKTLMEQPTANWSLPQDSGKMTYYNLVVGTRSYQLIVLPASKSGGPSATLLRFKDPKAKPEPIARGTLSPKTGGTKQE